MSSTMILLTFVNFIVGIQEARADKMVCGFNSVYLIARFLDKDIQLEQLQDFLPVDRAPFSMSDLESAARQLGFEARPLHFSDSHSARFTVPVILHVKSNPGAYSPDHFIACFGETSGGLIVADLPQPPFILPRYRLMEIWEGDALFLYPSNRIGAIPIGSAGISGLVIAVVILLFLLSRHLFKRGGLQ